MRETTIAVELQRLDAESQARLDWLLDHHNEGRLTPAEREELQRLVAQYEPVRASSPLGSYGRHTGLHEGCRLLPLTTWFSLPQTGGAW
jgi:hypothetical protein